LWDWHVPLGAELVRNAGDSEVATRILILPGSDSVAERLYAAAGSNADVQILSRATDAQSTVRLVGELAPDVVILDSNTRGIDIPGTSRLILVRHPRAKIVVISGTTEDRYIVGLLASGASGYLRAGFSPQEFRDCIETVTQNRLYIGSRGAHVRRAADGASGKHQAPDPDVLTPRELEVLNLLANGATTRSIAEYLYISEKTVETHRTHIMQKLDIHTIAGLTKYAVKHGITSLDT
jgi:DNA-binding NarL/FixJ family response regulator